VGFEGQAMMPRSIRIILATLSMYIVTHLLALVFLPFAILMSYLDRDSLPALKRWFVRSLFAIVGKELRVSGRENVQPDHEYVIISNYPSFYTGFALIGAFPSACVVAQAFVRKVPLVGQALSRMGAIFVQPGRRGLGRAAIDISLRGRAAIPSIIILPEGARTPDGRIHRFRRGFIHILRQTSHDLLPVTFNGLYQLKPVRRLYADPDPEPEMLINTPVSHAIIVQTSDEELLGMAHDVIARVYRP
jgi:1-acyl-sn-glycerol-3-phosphate acyltransferase